MEYSSYIRHQMPNLMKTAKINTTIIENCYAKHIISLEENQELVAAKTNVEKNSIFWKIISTRPGKLEDVKTIFGDAEQNGVVGILEEAIKNNIQNEKDSECSRNKSEKSKTAGFSWFCFNNGNVFVSIFVVIIGLVMIIIFWFICFAKKPTGQTNHFYSQTINIIGIGDD